jgi:polyhydroxybutyrate depolymerase
MDMGIQPLAESEGFLYCHPDGVPDSKGSRFWNAWEACCDFEQKEINDVAFLRELIEQITREYHPDPKRIHMSGHSNGAFMTFRFAMENSDLVASVAPISGTMDQITTVPAPAHPVSVLQIHGTADEAIPYNGGKLTLPAGFPEGGVVASAPEAAARWSKWNSCGELMAEAQATLDSDRTLAGLDTIVSRSVCTDGIAVEHWAILEGLHSPNWSTNFTKTMVQWLLAHSKP